MPLSLGGLPLGLVVTSDEKTSTLIEAFQAYKEMLEGVECSFFGRDSRGPQFIMTDNCEELRDALAHTWPDATLLLCVFHILQQVNPFRCSDMKIYLMVYR